MKNLLTAIREVPSDIWTAAVLVAKDIRRYWLWTRKINKEYDEDPYERW